LEGLRQWIFALPKEIGGKDEKGEAEKI